MTTLSAAATAIDNTLTLESVRDAFNHWRSARGHEKKIPDYLWQQVSKIMPYYRQCKILTALRLNHYQIRKNLNLIQPQSFSKQKTAKKQPIIQAPSSFVKAFLPTSTDHSYQVEWQRSDGNKLTITHLDAPGLSLLIQNWRG